MSETSIQNEIRNAMAGHCMLFRVNVGMAWTGNDIRKLKNGAILIMDPRPFSTGVPPGFSDLFGLVTVEITPEMVGQKFARFLAGEVKTATGRKRKTQGPFLDAIKRAGGLSDVWRSPADALRTIGK